MGKLLILIIGFVTFSGCLYQSNVLSDSSESNESVSNKFEQKFLPLGLRTNTAVASIPLEKIISGGPRKDGIPAMTRPKFTSISERSSSIADENLGIAVGGRFYPYNILVWHEIVNDEIEGKPIAVTFCPLCGSAIVFERTVDGEVLEFGVSGLLYQSNLLMYDKKTESLWSQVLGKSVVGDYNGKVLELVKSSVMTLSQFKELQPDGKVLSVETGYDRDYSYHPYGNYDENNEFYFPVGFYDDRLPAKEIVFALRVGERLLLFPLLELNQQKSAEITFENMQVSIEVEGGETTAKIDGEETAGFYAMYFSIVVHEPDAAVWTRTGIK